MLRLVRLFEAIKLTAHLFYAASGGSNHAVIPFEILDEETVGGRGVLSSPLFDIG